MTLETANMILAGEIDGAYFGGHVKPANYKEDRKDRRLSQNQTGKRRCVVAMRHEASAWDSLSAHYEMRRKPVPTLSARLKGLRRRIRAALKAVP